MTNSDPKTSAEPAFAQYPSHGRSMIQCKMMRRIDKIIIFFSDLARTLMKDVVIDVGIRLRMELGVKNRYLIKNWWTSNLMKSCAKIRCWDENTENRLWNRDFLLCSYSSNLFNTFMPIQSTNSPKSESCLHTFCTLETPPPVSVPVCANLQTYPARE